MANLSTSGFIVIFLLSNVVQNAVIGNDNSLIGGVIGAVTLIGVNAALTRLIAISATAERILDGQATTVIASGQIVDGALRRLGLRRSEIDHAVRLQNGDGIAQIQEGSLEPGGQLVLTLKTIEQNATKTDIAGLTDRLLRIKGLLTTPR